jgi:hypothetical protein
MTHKSSLYVHKGGIADLEDKVTHVTGRIWDRRME